MSILVIGKIIHKFYRNVINPLEKYKWRNQAKNLCYSEDQPVKLTEYDVEIVLMSKFPKSKIEVMDTSGVGAMFVIVIESPDFKNMTVLNRYKSVYNALEGQLKIMHGVHVICKVV